jgi:Neuraminidase (sialidase)
MRNAFFLCAICVCAFHTVAAELPASRPSIDQIICPTSPQNPRNGEGDVAVLKDGRLFLAYSHWTKGASGDDSPAEICAKSSSDGGRTWSKEVVLIPNDAMNLMSVSILRLHNGELMLVYGRRHSNARMQFYARFSNDEATTWSGDSLVTPISAYQAINNARVIQLKNGRLLAPVAMCRGKTWMQDYFFYDACYWSDDNGRTWTGGGHKLTVKGCSFGADEPAVIELNDGRVMMLIRTDTGRINRSFSSDRGEHWTAPQATDLASPSSPASIKRIPSTGDLLLVWNNADPLATNRGEPRNPLTCAVSHDEGKTWQHVRNIEDAPGADYCYASITFDKHDRVILSYYERAALKLRIMSVSELYQ